VIDEALDASRFLIAVGSSYKNLDSEWVRYEWESFLNDIRSRRKPNAEVFVLFSGMRVTELPRPLRLQQAFNADEKDSYEKLYGFIKNALGKREDGKANPPIDDVLTKKAKEEQERLEQEKRKREEAEQLEKLKKEREERNRLKREKIFQEIKKYSKYLLYILGGIVVIGLIILAINKCDSKPKSIIMDIVANKDTINDNSNQNNNQDEVIERSPEIKAEYSGGMQALMKFLGEKLSYPQDALDNNISGTVIVEFVVKADGTIDKVTVIEKVHPSLDKEAIRVVKLMDKWNAGSSNGVAVSSYFQLPVEFSLNTKGVVINGVRWATCNVDTPGTFAPTPESAGKFYQWNRKKAWATTGDVSGWDKSTPSGNTWEKINDPSPQGWRIPTKTELQSLLDTTKVNQRITQNGVKGRKFTDKSTGNSLFFPAAGWRNYSDGTLYGAGTSGDYWSSTGLGSSGAYDMLFYSFGASVYGYNSRPYGFSVRSVAE